MKQFYYTDGANKFGPMTIEDLKLKGIKPETLVWYEGLDNWVAASQLVELKSLFGDSIPPPMSAPTQNFHGTQQNPAPGGFPPKTWLVESILVTLFCCLPFGVVGIVYAAKVESLYNIGNYAAAQKASDDAGKWTKLGFWIGMGVLILYFVYIFAIIGVATGLNL